MTNVPRRIVTGHRHDGSAVIVADGPTPVVHTNPLLPGTRMHELWATIRSPAPIDFDEADPVFRPVSIKPDRHGTLVRMVDLPPDLDLSGRETTSKAAFAGWGSAEDSTGRRASPHPMMHRTETIDFGVCLSGEIWMVLDESETLVTAGDIVIQRGTNHAWVNRGTQVCRMLFVLTDGEFSSELREAIDRFENN